jgi:predicted DNA-binding WGR domain protein
MTKIYLECINSRSKKFYEIELKNKSVNMSFGKINGKEKYLNKKFEDKPTATNFYQKKLNSKLKTYSVSKKRFEQLRILFDS